MRRKVMKMAATPEIIVLLLCCSVISSADTQANCDIYAAAGENFMVPLKNHRLSETEILKWRHENSQIVHRKPVRNGNVVSSHKFLKGSSDNVYQNGSLKLTKVNKTHVGKYSPAIFTENGTLVPNLESLHLCIMDRVPEPKVLAECQSTTAKFTCNVAQTLDVKFEWLQNNQALKGENSQTLTLGAKNLGTYSFRCKVSNKVSSLTSEPVTHHCQKPTFVFPQKVMGLSIWIFVGGGGGIVLVLIMVVIVCCVWAKRKKRLQIKDEEELRLRWTNQEQQQPQKQQQRYFHHHSHLPNHHHHHHHHQQQPAGHTGPRQHRSKQHLDPQHPRANDPGSGHPQASPRRPAQTPRPPVNENDEQPPPLPQPRKKAPRAQRV